MKIDNRFLSILFVLVSFLYTSSSIAQDTWSIKGLVSDSSSTIKPANTIVTILHARDSVLYKFIKLKDDGSFSITNLTAGKYILLISSPGYADHTEPFSLDPANRSHDFGEIKLEVRTQVLAEVVIKAPVSMR